MLPPARYATGPGVADLICGRLQRRSLSLSDLQAAGAASGSGSPQRPLSPAPGGLHLAGSSQAEGGGGGGGGGGGMHRSESEGRLRRRSIMVGEVLFSMQQEQGDGAAGGAGAPVASAPGSGPGASLQRRSLQGPAAAPWQHSATPPARLSPHQAISAEGAEQVGLRGGLAPGPAAVAPSVGAADAEGNERGRPRLPGIQRRSVTVAEVLHYEESKLKVIGGKGGRGGCGPKLYGRHARRQGSHAATRGQASRARPNPGCMGKRAGLGQAV